MNRIKLYGMCMTMTTLAYLAATQTGVAQTKAAYKPAPAKAGTPKISAVSTGIVRAPVPSGPAYSNGPLTGKVNANFAPKPNNGAVKPNAQPRTPTTAAARTASKPNPTNLAKPNLAKPNKVQPVQERLAPADPHRKPPVQQRAANVPAPRPVTRPTPPVVPQQARNGSAHQPPVVRTPTHTPRVATSIPSVPHRATGGGTSMMQLDTRPTPVHPNRRHRVHLPPLQKMLFGPGMPTDGLVKGRYFAVNPDGSLAHMLGSFQIKDGAMSMFPAGGDVVQVLLNDAPKDGVLGTDYAHYATPPIGPLKVERDALGRINIGTEHMNQPRADMSRSSGTLNFLLGGGPTVDAVIQQKYRTVANGPTVTINERTQPARIRFIPG